MNELKVYTNKTGAMYVGFIQETIDDQYLINEKARTNSNTYPYTDARLKYGPKPENRRLVETEESIVYVKGNIRFQNGENGSISADERPFITIFAVLMIVYGILLAAWSKILKGFPATLFQRHLG